MKYNELTMITVKNAKPKAKEYKICDGNNLYLSVAPTGRKSWYVAYALDGKRKQINIGRYPVLSLKEARERTLEVQKLVLDGIDPVEKKREQKMLRQLSHENNFEAIALEWHESRKHAWKGKHGDVILGRLKTYIFPVIGKKPINEVKPYELLHAIKPIEEAGKHEMAHRMLQTSGQIYRYAVASGRAERNIAVDLKGALKPVKSKNYRHLQEADLPDFIKEINKYDAEYNGNPIIKWGFQLIMMIFVRTGELRGAKWEEIDFDKKVWRIPNERMKMGGMHIVPLSEQSIKLLKQIYEVTGDSYSGYVFPNFHNPRKCISENTFLRVIQKVGYKERTTTHGFRTVASTILNENGFRADIIEKQLAHEDRNQVRAVYNHADYLSERREMMQWYSGYLVSKGLDV